MEKLILLLADYANMDQAGKLNVLGAFGRLSTAHFPVKHPSMYLVIKLAGERKDSGQTKQLSVKLVDDDGGELAMFRMHFEVATADVPEANFIIHFRDLEFPQADRYVFEVYVDDVQVGVLPLKVEAFVPTASAR